VASLQARSPVRSAHPLFFVNKIVSLSAFLVMLGAGWVVVSYLKTNALDRWRNGSPENVSVTKAATVPLKEASLETKSLSPSLRLVYSCAADKEFYHVSTHLPARCERTAVSEEAAIQRGLKRCRTCFPD
jgi:hypothetical protein